MSGQETAIHVSEVFVSLIRLKNFDFGEIYVKCNNRNTPNQLGGENSENCSFF